jgi:polyisoprenoid-binding protein YceI
MHASFRSPFAFALAAALALAAGTARSQTAYQVATGSSRVYIKVTSATRLGHNHGVEGRLASGDVVLGGPGVLVFDMTSLTADTPQARQYVGLPDQLSASDAAKVNANMRGGEVLDVGHYPQAACTIAELAPAGGQQAGQAGAYRTSGQFTLHGVTRPVTFDATVEATDRPGVLRARGSFAIQQTAFGIRPYTALGGLVGISDRLDVWGDLVLVPKGR